MRDTRLGLVFALFALFSAGATFAWHGQTLVVEGQDDVVVDRPAIQAAVDGASPGDTIELRGTFRLDGTSILVSTSRLTIAGQSIDNDGDGVENEDPADGVDNDGDGSIDEDDWDARLEGVDDGAGGPAEDLFPNRFNDGFELRGGGDLRRVSFRDLAFSRLNRAIYVFPDYDDAGSVLVCDSSTPTPGSAERISVKRNSFEDTRRGVEAAGRVRFLTVQDNRFVRVRSQSILLFGQELQCAEPDGSLEQFLPLGTPEWSFLVRNESIDSRLLLLSFISKRTSVLFNEVRGAFFGIVSLEDGQLFTLGNSVEGAVAGFFGSYLPDQTGPSSGNVVVRNTLSDNLYGAIVDCDSTGYALVNNEFAGSAIVDVLLDGTSPGGECAPFGLGDSFENTVVATRFPTVVQDFGVDNRLIGSQIVVAP